MKLSDDLWMPAAADLDSIVDLEDRIREAERQIDDDAEVNLSDAKSSAKLKGSWRPIGQ